MEPRFYIRKLSIIVIISCMFDPIAEARLSSELILKKLNVLEAVEPSEPTNGKAYGLPSLPPLESEAPFSQPIESPISYVGSPPLPSILPPFPPTQNIPIKSPAGPPIYTPIPTPPRRGLNPPAHQYPVEQPPPSAPPPPHKKPQFPVWCVAKPTVSDTVIQEALDYACGSGADCKPIQPNGQCFVPNTLVSHASYAFNSYWQKTKAAGGTCDFGGTAMLVTIDPSFNDCYFTVN